MVASGQGERIGSLDLHDHGARQVDSVEGEGAYRVRVVQAAGRYDLVIDRAECQTAAGGTTVE